MTRAPTNPEPARNLGEVTQKVSVDLSGAPQTMLATLYLKALDADFARPILGDRFAKDAAARLDYDFTDIGITAKWAPLITVRTAQYDIWARQFLAVHPRCTVVHLGCGMDSRVFRLDPGPDVRWFDVDYPEVIALREKVFPSRPGYRLLPTSATDMSWLDQIPADGPVLLLAEGISMYLTEDEGVALLSGFVDRFGSGELQIDFYNRLAIRSQKGHTLVRRTGSKLFWGGRQPAGRSEPGARHPPADRRDVVRRQHLSRRAQGLPGGGPAEPHRPAAAPHPAVPSLCLRARQLTPLAACCSATLRSTVCISSTNFSGPGACVWYSTTSWPAKILLRYMSMPALTAK